ncbi:hypothetical protein A3Q56_01017 [Intoshia linei]|uniref:Gamma-tubulin complex component n=1 Tax=Intoshia linei TaxID=1819745 RepID=A0A177BC61_9BILA|nr:hypothetical protein A3Q56_01017 [Intoshia linei]
MTKFHKILKKNVLELTNTINKKSTEKYIDKCVINLFNHKYLSPNNNEIDEYIKDLCESYYIKSNICKSKYLRILVDKYLTVKNFAMNMNTTEYAMISLLLNLACSVKDEVNYENFKKFDEVQNDLSESDSTQSSPTKKELIYEKYFSSTSTLSSDVLSDYEPQGSDQETTFCEQSEIIEIDKSQEINDDSLKLEENLIEIKRYWDKNNNNVTIQENVVIRECIWYLLGINKNFNSNSTRLNIYKLEYQTLQSYLLQFKKVSEMRECINSIRSSIYIQLNYKMNPTIYAKTIMDIVYASYECINHYSSHLLNLEINISKYNCNANFLKLEKLWLQYKYVIEIFHPIYLQLLDYLKKYSLLEFNDSFQIIKSTFIVNLLSRLYKNLQSKSILSGYNSEQSYINCAMNCLVFTFLYSLKCYFNIIEYWLFSGCLKDEYNEFFVERIRQETLQISPNNTNCYKFTTNIEELPFFDILKYNIIDAVSEINVVETNQTINQYTRFISTINLTDDMYSKFIKKFCENLTFIETGNCKENYDTINNIEDLKKKIFSESVEIILERKTISIIMLETISDIINMKIDNVKRNCLMLIRENHGHLLDKFILYLEIFTCTKINVSDIFLQRLYRCIGSDHFTFRSSKIHIRNIINVALSDINCKYYRDVLLENIEKCDETLDVIDNLRMITIKVNLDTWFLNSIFDNDILSKYNDCFSFMTCLNYARFKSIGINHLKKSLNPTKYDNLLNLLQYKLYDFFQGLSFFVYYHIIEHYKKEMTKKIETCETLLTIIDAHKTFICSIHTLMLLHEEKFIESVIDIIKLVPKVKKCRIKRNDEDVVELCIEFDKMLCNLNNSASNLLEKYHQDDSVLNFLFN